MDCRIRSAILLRRSDFTGRSRETVRFLLPFPSVRLISSIDGRPVILSAGSRGPSCHGGRSSRICLSDPPVVSWSGMLSAGRPVNRGFPPPVVSESRILSADHLIVAGENRQPSARWPAQSSNRPGLAGLVRYVLGSSQIPILRIIAGSPAISAPCMGLRHILAPAPNCQAPC